MPVGSLCYTGHADSYLRIEKPKNHEAYGCLFTLGSFSNHSRCPVYIELYTYISIHTYTYIHAYLYTNRHIQTYTHTNIYIISLEIEATYTVPFECGDLSPKFFLACFTPCQLFINCTIITFNIG